MSMPASILLYGLDPGLLQTRTWVFQGAGYRVASVFDLNGMLREATASPPDLLVLCHSLSDAQRQEALRRAGMLQPGMKRLLLTADSPLHTEVLREDTVSAFDGPRAMLAATAKVLNG